MPAGLEDKLKTLRAAGVSRARFEKGELTEVDFFAGQPDAAKPAGEQPKRQVDLLREVVLAEHGPVQLDAEDFPDQAQPEEVQ